MPGEDDTDVTFRDAEEWLAERGIEPRDIAVPDADEAAGGEESAGDGEASSGGGPDRPPRAPHPARTDSRRAGEDAADVDAPASGPPEPASGDGTEDGTGDRTGDGTQEAEPDAGAGGEPDRPEDEEPGRLEDEVTAAVATARRSTAQSPKSEEKLAERLAAKGYRPVVIDLAMERCRDRGIVDDEAYARMFVDERNRKGHGPFRIRRDLEQRGIPERIIDVALEALEEQDQEARAFDLAQDKARRSSGEDAETAYRRTVSYVARRGYPKALARKVARQAVFDAREEEQTSSR